MSKRRFHWSQAKKGSTSQRVYIAVSDGRLAFSVSGLSDGHTLAVVAFGESSAATGINGNQADNSAVASGAVYVYRAQ